MDREPEDPGQLLGALAIVGEALKILRSNSKLLVALTVNLILPHSFAILGHNLVSKDLFNNINISRGEKTQSLEWMKLFIFLAAYEIFVLAFSMPFTAAVLYTVASIYTGKEVSYAKVISVVPTVWKRLVVTFHWFFVIVCSSYQGSISAIYLLIYSVGVDKSNYRPLFILGLILMIAVCFCLYVYINMVWQLACVISVLEDQCGRGALCKSNDLIKGKQITTLALGMVYFIIVGFIEGLFRYAVIAGRGQSVALMAVYAVLLVGLLCFVNLMGLLTQSVFYFVCKSYHHESIDKSSLSDHLEVYLGDYEPLKSNIIQLEDLHGSV